MSTHGAIERDAGHGAPARRVLQSLDGLDALLIALALLYVLVAPEAAPDQMALLAVIAAYGAAVFSLRRTAMVVVRPRLVRFAGASAMVFFITAILASAGGRPGPLSGFYLLPVVAAALTLGREASVLILVQVVACRASLTHFLAHEDVLTFGYGAALFTETLPVLLVALLVGTLVEDAQETDEKLRAISDQDDLTGALNLQAFTRLVEDELQRTRHRGTNFALLLVDVEGLKAANERYGHEAGNRALKALAQALQRSCRSVDLVARYGGDEFVMFLSGAGAAVAKAVANRVRHNVATTTLEFGGKLHRVTVTVGSAVFPADGQQLHDLVNKAAARLERDKDSRRPLPQAAARA